MNDKDCKLRILLLITKSNFGGAQRYVYDLATSLHQRGHDVTVGFGGSGVLAEKMQQAGIRTIALPFLERDVNMFGDVRTFFQLFQLIKKENPDIVHLNSSKIGALGALATRCVNSINQLKFLIGKKPKVICIIFTAHGWALAEERPDWEKFFIACIHWLTITLSHKTIAVSKATREEVSRLPFVWHKICVVHNGIENSTTLSRQESLQELLGTQTDLATKNSPLIVGTIGELHKNKGLSYAIEGIAQLKKIIAQPTIFIIIGEGEERKHLEKLRDQLDLAQQVFLVGFKKDASTLISCFDVFLFPSIKEGFPYAILEAGKIGLPIIATGVGGIPEVIDDMESGILIHARNSGEVAHALQFLVEHPERRKQFGERIQSRIQDRFSLEVMLDQTLLVYKEQLALHLPPHADTIPTA